MSSTRQPAASANQTSWSVRWSGCAARAPPLSWYGVPIDALQYLQRRLTPRNATIDTLAGEHACREQPTSPPSTRAPRAPAACSSIRRTHRRGGPDGASADLPAARLGRAQPGGDLATDTGRRPGHSSEAGVEREQIAAVGITSQRETTVVWNRATGRPVYNAIVWQDTRTDQIVNELAQNGGQDRFRQKTGLPLATLLLRPQSALDSRPRARRPRGRRTG